jgi:hypothetical protein
MDKPVLPTPTPTPLWMRTGTTASSVATVHIKDQPLTLSCSGSASGSAITWSATGSGGRGSYTFSWTDTDSNQKASSIDPTWQLSYSASGTKTATVTVTDTAGISKTASCTASVTISVTPPPPPPPPPSAAPISRGKSVTASNQLSDSPASNAVDGDTTTIWNSGKFTSSTFGGGPQWITIDLGTTYSISEVKLTFVQTPAGFSTNYIYGSVDGSTWTLLFSWYNSWTFDLQVVDYNLPTASAAVRYVKVTTTDSPSWVAWRDIDVYGTSAVAPTPTPPPPSPPPQTPPPPAPSGPDTNLGKWTVVYHPIQYSDGFGNLYAPAALFVPGSPGYWIAYFGGWGDSTSQVNDKIYYSTSADGGTWTAKQTLFTSQDFNADTASVTGCNVSACNIASNNACGNAACAGCAVHVNVPDVTRDWNSISGNWQWTMVQEPGICSADGNMYGDIWSAVSNDGIHWAGHQWVVGNPTDQAHEATIITDPGTYNGTSYYFKVYYYYTGPGQDCHVLKMALLDGGRQTIAKDITVFTSSDSLGCVVNPEVRKVGLDTDQKPWQLFFQCNSPHGTRWNICRVPSATNTSWATADARTVIDNESSSSVFGTVTPGVISWPNSRYYDLFFGVTNTDINSNPSLAGQRYSEIDRWREQINDALFKATVASKKIRTCRPTGSTSSSTIMMTLDRPYISTGPNASTTRHSCFSAGCRA